MSPYPSTQTSIAIAGPRRPLITVSSPVKPPCAGQVLIRVCWTASTPLDLHRADGGLLVDHYPYLSGGGGAAGTIAAVSGSGDTKGLAVGDPVTSFAFHGGAEANHQEYVTAPAYLVSTVPQGSRAGAAVAEARQQQQRQQQQQDANVLVWGASGSVGLFAVQVLRHRGYRRVLAVAGARHHGHLRGLGATACFDYTTATAAADIQEHVREKDGQDLGGGGGGVPFILDCIGSLHGSLAPLTRIAGRGSTVAVMLPVIVKDATATEEPEYEMDVARCWPEKWAEGVDVRGVRRHFYLGDPVYKEKMQPEIIPELLARNVVQPNRLRVVEGATMLERAQRALDLLRDRAVSGERLVWRVSDEQ